MSLLDRVQRKAEGTTPSAPAPSAPAAPAPAAPDRPLGDGADRFPPAGWQNRPGGVSPAPVPAQAAPAPAPAPKPFEVERPAPAPEPQRQPTLLNRAGGLRPGLSKMSGHVNTHVALRGKVHQRLVEELAQGTDSVPPDMVRQRIAELLNDVITEQNITMSRPIGSGSSRSSPTTSWVSARSRSCWPARTSPKSWSTATSRSTSNMHGKLTLSPVTFESDQQLMQVIDRIVSSIGRRVDEFLADGRRAAQGWIPCERRSSLRSRCGARR